MRRVSWPGAERPPIRAAESTVEGPGGRRARARLWSVSAVALLVLVAACADSGGAATRSAAPGISLLYVSLVGEGAVAVTSSGEPVGRGIPAGLNEVSFSADGTRYAADNGRLPVIDYGDGSNVSSVVAPGGDSPAGQYTAVGQWPSLSPDARSVAFEGVELSGAGAQIVVSDLDGGQLRVLTSDTGIDAQPAWSPAGGEIVYTHDSRNDPQLYAVNLFGGERQLVIGGRSEAFSMDASWSPDGSTIAFAQTGTTGYHVAVVHPDGTGYRQVTPDENLRSPVGATAWSPDGRQIAYVTRHDEVNIVNADGSDPHEVYVAPTAVARLSWRALSPALALSSDDYLDALLPRRSRQSVTFVARAVGGADLSAVTVRVGFSRAVAAAASAPGASCSQTSMVVTCSAPALPGDQDLPVEVTFEPLAPGRLAITGSASAANQSIGGSSSSVVRSTVVSQCTVIGTSGADHLRASKAGGDYICGGAGNDTINAVNGKRDTINGGPGRDTAIVDRKDIVRRVEHVVRR